MITPFTAEVAIMRLIGSAPKSHLCDQRRRSKVIDLSDLMTLFIDLGCFICNQTQRAFNVKKKHAKLTENRFSRSKIELTRVWELFTRCWNTWHWESHCVLTASGERVKKCNFVFPFVLTEVFQVKSSQILFLNPLRSSEYNKSITNKNTNERVA
jgi:hypothetical protein